MKASIVFLFVYIGTNCIAKDIQFIVVNNTGQKAIKLEMWVGSETQSKASSLVYSPKGTLDSGRVKKFTLYKYHKKKRNTVKFRIHLIGGGYIETGYKFDSANEPLVELEIINGATPVPTDAFNTVMDAFTSLDLDKEGLGKNSRNAVNSQIGALIVRNSKNKVVYKIDPGVFKTKVNEVVAPDLIKSIHGTFSTQSSIAGDVKLPFISMASAFSKGDVASFTWELEDTGQFIWSSETGQDLAVLFDGLPLVTKKVLYQLYDEDPDLKVTFLNKALYIGRLEVKTKRSRKVQAGIELNASNIVTAKGNYLFVDDLDDKFVVKDIVTTISGYDVSILLRASYIAYKSSLSTLKSTAEKDRIESEYAFLRELYPELVDTQDTKLMEKSLLELKNKNGGISFLTKSTESIISNKDELAELLNSN